MGNWYIDKRIIATVVIGVIVVVTAVVWLGLEARMKGQFAQALRHGQVTVNQIQMQDKKWSEAEIAGAKVMKLVSERSSTHRRSVGIGRMIQSFRGFTVPGRQYTYQATVTDAETGYRHIFGYKKGRGWEFASLHPEDSIRAAGQRMEDFRSTGQPPIQGFGAEPKQP